LRFIMKLANGVIPGIAPMMFGTGTGIGIAGFAIGATSSPLRLSLWMMFSP